MMEEFSCTVAKCNQGTLKCFLYNYYSPRQLGDLDSQLVGFPDTVYVFLVIHKIVECELHMEWDQIHAQQHCLFHWFC